MMRAKTPRTDRNRKAPAEKAPAAPAERRRDKQRQPAKPVEQEAARRESKRIPYSAGKPVNQPSRPSAHPRESTIGARVSRRAADRLRAGHVWVYASDVEGLELGEGEVPRLLPVADNRGLLLGTALYSPTSQIALRMVSREAIGETAWLDLLGSRLTSAIERRVPLLIGEKADTDSCRLCFSEADELPGLVVDKYGELVIVQLLAKGLDSGAVRERIVATIRELMSPASILERPDPRIRELEGLSAPGLGPLYARDLQNPLTATGFQLNALRFHYDANAGQKTGAFLDQRTNYQAAQTWAKTFAPGGRALDVCTYQGGFALHLARGVEARNGDRHLAQLPWKWPNGTLRQSRQVLRRSGLGRGRRVSRFCATGLRHASSSIRSCSIRRPLQKASGQWKERCEDTRS